jgi:hypothetical protein
VTEVSGGFLPRSRTVVVALCWAAGSLGLALEVQADWLVTREQARIETKGPWEVKGKRIIFTTVDGTFSSLRLAEVDLDASRLATAEATAAPAPPPPPKKKSVRTLTDKDFSRAEAVAAPKASADSTAEGDQASSETSATTGQVQMLSWKQNYSQESRAMEITGTVRNAGPVTAAAVAVTVRLYDDRGQLIAEQAASLNTRSLRPDQTTAFTAVFPSVVFFDTAKFEVQSQPLTISPKAPPPTSEDQPAADQPAGEAPPPPR